ncbi:uncharacterized protein FOMMEDRAFT_154704 [Fomitiporia mediterranea MF3/22]|uniref:uncharacterized protein n=1 Tax=Fomitiporia mediterranea (strain MF3/22) TaxID=694068 RepID=UPI000440794D|nr:uncharacterized protein FOMMEDRAFT_154704 [Fomitiporia mediterranea MF3/22]EJD03616.1 hypothetical protein FOMMEDRAFT_154704 [Fomitiporia mediterranea MF3/22]
MCLPPVIKERHTGAWIEKFAQILPPFMLDHPLNTKLDLDRFFKNIFTLAANTFFLDSSRPCTRFEWWDDNLTEKLIGLSDESSATITRAILNHKQDYYLTKADQSNCRTLWMAARQYKRKDPCPIAQINDKDTFLGMDEEFTQAYFSDRASTVFAPLQYNPKVEGLDDYFTFPEFMESLHQINKSVLPSISGLTRTPTEALCHTFDHMFANVLQWIQDLEYIPTPLRRTQVSIISKMKDRAPDSPRAYQPISVEETFTKAIAKIYAEKCTTIMETHPAFPKEIYSRRKHLSTADAIYDLHAFVRKNIRTTREQSHACPLALFVDIQGFFDNIPLD